MVEDARFEDGAERPLNLGAMDVEDLAVLSALAQDAVFPVGEIKWLAKERRLGVLLNRFRWEDKGQGRHEPERVQSVLSVEHVTRVAGQGVDRGDSDLILSLLHLSFEPGEDGAGHVVLTLAGDGAIRAEVEVLEVRLKDVTRPYRAVSGKAPGHQE